jgi:hypothetical protein
MSSVGKIAPEAEEKELVPNPWSEASAPTTIILTKRSGLRRKKRIRIYQNGNGRVQNSESTSSSSSPLFSVLQVE